MHGYDLRKRLRGDFGLLSSLSFGSLYPALARLEAAGAVHELSPERHAPAAQSSGAWAFPHPGSIAGERAAFRARLASRRSAPARASGGTQGSPCVRAHGARRRGLPPLARDRGAQAGGRRGVRLALGVRPPPHASGSTPASPPSPCSARRGAGRLPSSVRVAVTATRPVRALPRGARRRGHGERSDLDRPSHRGRAGGALGLAGLALAGLAGLNVPSPASPGRGGSAGRVARTGR